ncbi:MAG: tetratricopeptide repeat protein [Pirellulales bacterium]
MPLEHAIPRLTAEMRTVEQAGKNLAPYHYLRGMIFHKQGEFSRTVDEYTQAMALEKPGNETLLLARAESRIEAEEYDAAAEDCEEVLTTSPKSAAALTVRGWIGYQRKKFPAALADLTAALAADPAYSEAYLIRGWVNDATGRYADAVKDLETCLKLDPLSSSAEQSGLVEGRLPGRRERDAKAALILAKAACEWDAYRSYSYLETLAAAQAANADFAAAVTTQTAAIKIAPPAQRTDLEAQLRRYREKQPYLATTSPAAPS